METIPQNIRVSLKEAKDLLESGNSKSAEKAREILLDLPEANEYGIYHLLLAKAAKELNQMDIAVAHLEKSLELKEDNMQAILRVAEHKLKKGHLDEASKILEKGILISKRSEDTKTGCKIGALLIKANENEKAISFLRELAKKYPNDKEIAYTLSLAFRTEGKNDLYVEECTKAIQMSTIESSIKQRIGLAKHYMTKQEYEKIIGTISPIEELEIEKFQSEDAKDTIKCLLALSHCKLKSLDKAKINLIEVKKQTTLLANYVWAAIQMEEGNIEAGYNSCQGIQILAQDKIAKLKKMKEKSLGEENSGEKEETKQKKKKIQNAETENLERVATFALEPKFEILVEYLDNVEKLAIIQLPG